MRALVSGIKRLLAGSGSTLEYAAALLLFAVMILTVLDVIGRYIFSAPLSGATELTEFGIALAVFCALPSLNYTRGHVAVDLLEKYIPLRARQIMDRIFYVLFAIALIFMGWRTAGLAARSLRRGEVSEYILLPVGIILYIVAALIFIAAVAAIATAAARKSETSSASEQEQHHFG